MLYNPHRFLAVPTEEPTMTTMVPTTSLMEDDITTTVEDFMTSTKEEEDEGENEAEQDGEFVFTSLPPGKV